MRGQAGVYQGLHLDPESDELRPFTERTLVAYIRLAHRLDHVSGIHMQNLPLAAARRPPVNWGNPQTWERFLWVVTGKQYQMFAFGLNLEEMPGRVAAWAALLGDQFGWWGLAIALVGAWGWWEYQS